METLILFSDTHHPSYLPHPSITLPSSSLQPYTLLIGFLMPQYALYSLDTSTHTSEEAKRSDVTTPISMLASLSTVCLLGWGVLLALTFSIQSREAVYASPQPFLQILLDVFVGRWG